jgi:hypothetical protein
MYNLRKGLLSNATLAGNQYRQIRRRDLKRNINRAIKHVIIANYPISLLNLININFRQHDHLYYKRLNTPSATIIPPPTKPLQPRPPAVAATKHNRAARPPPSATSNRDKTPLPADSARRTATNPTIICIRIFIKKNILYDCEGNFRPNKDNN